MSLFDEPNANAYTVDLGEGSKGKRLGFQDAFAASWDVQTKVNSLLGLEQSFRDREQAQIKKMREAGITPPKSLDEGEDTGTGPFGGAQFRQGRYSAAAQSMVDGGGWYTDEMVAERDEQIKKLQAEHPELGLKTYGDMFKDIQGEAQDAMKRAALPTTALGAVGGFIGGAAAGMNPVSDPVNFSSFIIGGGATALERIGVQGLGQAGVEAGAMAINRNKEVLTGEKPTFESTMEQLGVAAVGGAAGQGLGEAVGMGIRRATTGKWFNDLAPDKLPTKELPPSRPMDELTPHVEKMEPGRPLNDYPDFETFAKSQGYDLGNPYGPSRQAAARHAIDIDYVARELDRWDGPQAHDVSARTDTALPPDVEPGVRYDGAYQRYIDRMENVDDVARRLDPGTFDTYDKLAAKRDEIRASIDRVAAPDTRRDAARPDVAAEYASWQKATDQELRLQLQEIDYQMRDMAPLVSRAYGAAEKEWRSTPVDSHTLNFLKQLEQRTGFNYRGEGKPSLTEQPMRPKAPPEPLNVRTAGDDVPVSMMTPEQQAKLRPGHDAADRIEIVSRDTIDTLNERTEKFVAKVGKTAVLPAEELRASQVAAREKLEAAQLKAKEADTPESRKSAADAVKKAQQELDDLTGITLPDGQRLEFDAEMIGTDGNKTTVRDFLAEMQKNTDALEATRTCSVPS